MKNFAYFVAARVEDAFVCDGTATMPIAGGTELLNWFRLGIAAPDRIIDLARIDGLDGIRRNGDRLSIGALATLNTIGEDAQVAEHAAVLADACVRRPRRRSAIMRRLVATPCRRRAVPTSVPRSRYPGAATSAHQAPAVLRA